MKTEELREKIRTARDSYWAVGISPVTDEEYDELVEELHRRTGEYDPVCAPVVLSSGKVRHPKDHPMLSMNKVYSIEEVEKWMAKVGCGVYHVMPKYDGIALRRYANRVIATRGDGLVGENVTGVASDFVERSQPPHDTFVDGEAICLRSKFEQLAKLGYKNPRNAVSGILSSKDKGLRARASMFTFVPYPKYVWRFAFTYLEARGVMHDSLVTCVENVKQTMTDYPMDGIVFRVADSRLFQSLGHTDHHWRGQIALKFKGETAESYVEHIEWRVKNGTVTPVAVISPVNLDGAELTNVTLHNADYVKAHDIRVGDRIVVERAGGVIPSVVEVKPSEYHCKLFIPETCPVCRSGLLRDGARLYCPVCEAREKGAAK